MKGDPITTYGLIGVVLLVAVLLWNGRPGRRRRDEAKWQALLEQAARDAQKDEGP